MKTSCPSRNTSARNPSHLGSKIHPSPFGSSRTGLASIGRTGGLTGSRTASSSQRERFSGIIQLSCTSRALSQRAETQLGFGWHLVASSSPASPTTQPCVFQRPLANEGRTHRPDRPLGTGWRRLDARRRPRLPLAQTRADHLRV